MESSFEIFRHPLSLQDKDLKRFSREFREIAIKRRSVRNFSRRKVPDEIILNGIDIASKAPNGANKQPWHFVVIKSETIKKLIQKEAEKVESDFYHKRAPKTWLEDLSFLGVNENKPFLTEASHLVVIFEKTFDYDESQNKKYNYYVKESVGIAVGMMILSYHMYGLSTLTHTPKPMNFIKKLLGRPENEKPFLILAVGYESSECMVPSLKKKNLEDICDVV